MHRRIKHTKKRQAERASAKKRNAFSKPVVICSGKDCIRIPQGSILYCEAQPQGTLFFYSKNQSILSTKNLGYWEKHLSTVFWRIHDHWLVNSKKIKDFNFADRLILVGSKLVEVARRRLSYYLNKYKESGIR